MTVLSRPWARTAAVLLAGALLLTACQADQENGQETDDVGDNAEASETGGDYPVTVDTVYGEITLEEKPERIVSVTGPYAEMLVALGEQPVAFAGSPRAGDDYLAGHPWMEDTDVDVSVHDTDLIAEGYTPSMETVASYEPDLIIGQGADWGIDEEMFEQLSEIAPVYTTPYEYDQWDKTLSDLAKLTGTAEAGMEAIAEVEASFDEARERIEHLQGASYIYGDLVEQDIRLTGHFYLLEQLGLATDEDLAALESISLEALDQITTDIFYVMTWRSEDAVETLESDPRWGELPAVQNDAVIYADAALTNATELGPIAIPWALDQITAELEDATVDQAEQ